MIGRVALGPVDFGAPLALAALLALPLIGLAMWHEARRRRQADARYSGAPALRAGRSPALRRLRNALLLAAVTLLAVALARPRWGSTAVPVEQRGVDVVIVLDVSRSMAATDVAPTRAQAAAKGLNDLLAHLAGNRVGLVTFAGGAFERSPLTLDLDAVGALVSRAQAEAVLVQPGTDLRVAIEAALNMLRPEETRARAIVLVSDGEDLGGDIGSAVQRAVDRQVPIYTVFAATQNPTPLPASSGGTDVTRGDPSTLERIARATGGNLRELRGVAGLAVEFRRLRQTRFAADTQQTPIERFPWFLGATLALLLLHAWIPETREARGRRPAHRRAPSPGAMGGIALLLLVGCSGTAAYRHVQAGNREYARARYEPALAEYRAAGGLTPNDAAVKYNAANALYQLQRHEEAAVTVSDALHGTLDAPLNTRLLYTDGNTAVQRGELQHAREAFEGVLRRDPTDRDAKANLELVLRALQPPTPPPQQPPAQQPGPQTPQQPSPPNGADAQGTPPPGQPGAGTTQPGTTAPQTGQPGSGTPVPGEGDSAEAVRVALDAALAQLGPEVTEEQARQILALAQRANDLQRLTPGGQGRGTPPR